MKSLSILVFSAVLLLLVPSVSLGSINVGNQINFSHYFDEHSSAAWGTLSFGSSINATTYGCLGVDYRFPSQDPNKDTLILDNCSVIYYIKPDIATITLGYFDYDCGTSYVRTLNSTFSSLKAPLAVRMIFPVTKNVSARMGYLYQEQSIDTGKEVYNLACEYKMSYFGVGVDVVKPDKKDYCYVLNSYFQPLPNINAYLHYGSDQNHDNERITGLTYTIPSIPLEITAEYNFDQDPANLFGYQFLYKIDKNSTLLYSRAVKTTELNELRLTITW